jgi:integrase
MFKSGDWHLKSLIFHLKNFSNGKEIRLMDVSPELLVRFQDYLSSRVSQNTIYGYIKMFRSKMNEAYRKDIITINPFDKYDMPHTLEPKRTTLDYEEVQKLYNTPFPSHPHVRLLFLFSCFTGLRISDCMALKWEDILTETDNEGNNVHFLNIKPVKTLNSSGKTLKVPLTESAISILDEVKEEESTLEKVFYDIPTKRNASNLLKLWAARAGIKKNVHFHVARHSFATISLTFGMDIYTVSKLLGHVDLRNTEIYAKIVDEKKRFEIQKLPTLQ